MTRRKGDFVDFRRPLAPRGRTASRLKRASITVFGADVGVADQLVQQKPKRASDPAGISQTAALIAHVLSGVVLL